MELGYGSELYNRLTIMESKVDYELEMELLLVMQTPKYLIYLKTFLVSCAAYQFHAVIVVIETGYKILAILGILYLCHIDRKILMVVYI